MDNEKTIELEAFKMHEGLYFIGHEEVSVHLIVTEEGLVMLDTGYPFMEQLILDNIKKLGYDPKDLIAIFHTHGHVDHFANTLKYVELSGAKTYISRIDNDILNGKKDLSWAKELGWERLPFFDCDVLLEDGDEFTFGRTKIRCILTPGHTEGVMSYVITLADGTVAAMHGGIGSNSMMLKYLKSNGLPADLRRQFKEGLYKLEKEKVDIVLGNHPEQTKTLEKLIRVKNGETDLRDPEEWGNFMAYNHRRIDKLMREDVEG